MNVREEFVAANGRQIEREEGKDGRKWDECKSDDL